MNEKKNIKLQIEIVTLIIMLGIAAWQIAETRIQNKKWNTISIIKEYDLNTTISDTKKRIYKSVYNETEKKFDYTNMSLETRRDVITILNYFNSIAIGVNEGVYDLNIVYDHLSDMITTYVNTHIKGIKTTRNVGSILFNEGDVPHLMSLYKKLEKIDEKEIARTKY